MQKFIAKYGSMIQGTLSGWDRLVFRGSIRQIQHPRGMHGLLWHHQVLRKEFGKYANEVTEEVKTASLAEAARQGRPNLYLVSSKQDKKSLAEEIAARDQINSGLICVLRCVEPCLAFDVGPDRASKQLQIRQRWRKCLFLYHYWMHPEFGFMSARIQTWFPFQVQVYLNGREWLARQMERAGIEYVRQENCFPWVADYEGAQALLDEQGKMDWRGALGGIADQLNPIHSSIFDRGFPASYYWSTIESEWATDIGFRGDVELRRLFPLLIEHGMTCLTSADVMRFLGRKLTKAGEIRKDFAGEVSSDIKQRVEGVRIKHRVDQNSVKMYDKAHREVGSVLRVEATVNNQKVFRVYRASEGEPNGKKRWRPMRRGLADQHRRGEVGQQINNRYLDALASVDDSARLREVLEPIEKRQHWKGRSVRALHPFSHEDGELLKIIGRGECVIVGIRNCDLRGLPAEPPTNDLAEQRRRSALASRQLRLLRAHGIIRKIKGRHLYQITAKGRGIVSLFLLAREASANQLIKKAA